MTPSCTIFRESILYDTFLHHLPRRYDRLLHTHQRHLLNPQPNPSLSGRNERVRLAYHIGRLDSLIVRCGSFLDIWVIPLKGICQL
jgi:hypothetical protein